MIHSGITRARCQHKQNFEQNWKTFTSQRGQIVFPPRSHKYKLGFLCLKYQELLYTSSMHQFPQDREMAVYCHFWKKYSLRVTTWWDGPVFCGGLSIIISLSSQDAFVGPPEPFFSHLIYPVLSPNSRFPGNFRLLLFSKSFTETQCLINEESSCVDSVQRKRCPSADCNHRKWHRVQWRHVLEIKV